MNRTATNCQPCDTFIPAGRHDCYGGCVGGTVEGCENCHGDHHVGGWQTCPKRGQRKHCRHPACVAVEKEANVETIKPMTGMPAAEFEIDRMQKAIAALRTECDTVTRERDATRAEYERLRQHAAEMNAATGRAEKERDEAVALFGQERAARLSAEAKAVPMRDLLLSELRWHEADPENQRCTLSRLGALRDALGLEPGAPLPDANPGAHCDYQAEVVRDAEGAEHVRCANCHTPAGSTPDPLTPQGMQNYVSAEVERLSRRVADLAEAVNGIGSKASIRDILGNMESGLASLLLRVNEVDMIEIVKLRSALLDLARLVAIQADTAKSAATAQGLNANGIRLDATAIVAKLGGGK